MSRESRLDQAPTPPPGATVGWYLRNPEWYLWNGRELPALDGETRLQVETGVRELLAWSKAALDPLFSLSRELNSLEWGTVDPDLVLRRTSHIAEAVANLAPIVERLRSVAHEIQQDQKISVDLAQNDERNRPGESVDTRVGAARDAGLPDDRQHLDGQARSAVSEELDSKGDGSRLDALVALHGAPADDSHPLSL